MSEESKSWWTQTPVIIGSITALIAAVVSLVTALDKAGVLKSDAETAEVTEAPASTHEARNAEAELRMLRRDPQLLMSADADIALVQLRLFDARRNPIGAGIANQFESKVLANIAVTIDHATGLTWLRDTSEPVSAEGASIYVRELREKSVAGHSDWRIPTLEEALSLMEPKAVNSVHLDPAMQRKIFVVQTADTAVDDRKWVVYFSDGFVSAEKRDVFAPVLAVRSDPLTTLTAR